MTSRKGWMTATLAAVVALVAQPALAHGPSPHNHGPATEPYMELRPFEGFIRCQVFVSGAGSDDACRDVGGGRSAFDVPHAGNLTGMILLLEWDQDAATTPSALRIQTAAPWHGADAWTGPSPLRVPIDAAGDALRNHAGRLDVRVLPPEDTGVIVNQAFHLDVALLYNGLVPTEMGMNGYVPGDEGLSQANPEPPGQGKAVALADPRTPAAHGDPGLWADGWIQVVSLSSLLVAATPRGRWALAAVIRLFTRVDPDKAAQHPRRAELLDHVRQNPGSNAEAVRTSLGLANGVFDHHVRVLARHGLVRLRRVEGMVCLFPAPTARQAAVTARMPLRRRIMEALIQEPGLRQVDLAERMDVPARRVGYHVRALARAGRLRLEASGRSVRCFPVDTSDSA